MEEKQKIKEIVRQWEDKKGSLIMMLHNLQSEFGYIPRDAAIEIAKEAKIPLARIYEVLTFYHYFKISPPAKYLISVCKGTACYLKGASNIIKELKGILKVEEGQVTEDGLFMFQTVRCLGCCGLAPVIDINGKIFSQVTPEKIREIVSDYRRQK